MGKRLEITQDVFVKVKKLEDVEQLKEPLCPAPDVSPADSRLRTLDYFRHPLSSSLPPNHSVVSFDLAISSSILPCRL